MLLYLGTRYHRPLWTSWMEMPKTQIIQDVPNMTQLNQKLFSNQEALQQQEVSDPPAEGATKLNSALIPGMT